MSELFTSSPYTDHARLAALYDVSKLLGSSLNLDEVLVMALDAAIRLTAAERGFLMLLENDGQLSFRVARNAQQETLPEALFEVSRSVVAEAVTSGKPVVTFNAQADPRFSHQASVRMFGLRSIMAAPLIARGKTVGALYVDSKAQQTIFGENDLVLLDTFAGQAAVALENARLYTHTDQALAARVAELEAQQAFDRELNATLNFEQVMGKTLDWALRRARADTGWIGMVEPAEPDLPARVRVVAGAGIGQTWPLDHPVLAEALTPGETPTSAGVETLAVPITREGQPSAMLVVQRTSAPFDSATRAALSRLADHAATAIENARLYTRLQSAHTARNKFVDIVVHEFKVPMTSIKGYADIMRRGIGGALTEDQTQFLGIISHNVERMAALLNDLTEISRLDSGMFSLDLAALDVPTLVEEVVAGFKESLAEKNQTLTLNLSPGLPTVRADRSSLLDILAALLSNAHKYTPAGGQLVISAAVAPQRLSASGPHPAGDAVLFTVADSGIGISPEQQMRLFTPFFRGDHPAVREHMGWGLSLHLARRQVELQGGELTVQSEGVPGQGSVFLFTIPVAA